VDGVDTFYVYDEQGRLSAEVKAVNLTSGGQITACLYPVAAYIWGPDRALAKLDNVNGMRYYYVYNGHGDVIQVLDTAGNIVNSYEYDVWGNFTNKQETIHNPFTYFCQTYDESTGLYYLRARYYDPATGRFTQEDPIKDGYNWYVYGNSNPVMFIDPTGYYADGDENLPDIIQFIINGEDRRTGGLTAVWNNSWNNPERRKQVAQVAQMLRSYSSGEYDFDMNSIARVMLLNNEGAVRGAGHNALMLRDINDRALLFSFNPDEPLPYDTAEMRMDILPTFAYDSFLKNGYLPVVIGSNGQTANESYSRMTTIDITTEQGKQMLVKGMSIFQYPEMYILAGKQCDNIASTIMTAGNKGYFVNVTPNLSFTNAAKTFGTYISHLGGVR
jgi:RHS repeat-associated protein